MSKIAALFLMIFAFSTAVCEVSAQDFKCPPKPAKEKRARNLAGSYFKKGEKLFVAEKYNKAIDRFLCSMTMVEHPNTVFNIAQSAELAEDKKPAHDAITAYLEAHPDSATAAELQEIIDGLADELGLGEPKPESEPEPALPEEPEPEPETSPQDAGVPVKPLRIAGFVTAGAGIAGIAFGGIFLGLAASSRDDAENAETIESYQKNKDDWKSRNRIGTIGMITGSALAVTGGLLILTSYLLDDSDTEDSDGDVDIAVLPSRFGLTVTGRF